MAFPAAAAELLFPEAPLSGMAIRTSVLIVGYNSQADLGPCLESIRAAGVEAAEVIVVDNASGDGTGDWLRQEFPEVRLIQCAENLGFGGANNLGARAARGDYLIFLNPDTTVAPGWDTALIAALDAQPAAGLATSRILLMADPARINTCGNDIHISGLTLCRGMGKPAATFPQVEPVDGVSGAAFAVRRELFEALGGFDETFFMYMEDTDLSWRVQLMGYTCLYVPESRVYHDYTLNFGPRKTFYQERNRYLMLLKVLKWRTLLALLPVLVLAEGVTWGFVLLQDRSNWKNKLRACAWIVQHWDAVRSRRRAVQGSRRISDRALLRGLKTRLDFEQTGQTWAAALAHAVFDPLFYGFKALALFLSAGER